MTFTIKQSEYTEKAIKSVFSPFTLLSYLYFNEYRKHLLDYQLHSSEPVFLNKNGCKMNPRGLHKVFKEILEKAGLPPKNFSLHHLRHTFATLLLQESKNKVDLRTLIEKIIEVI